MPEKIKYAYSYDQVTNTRQGGRDDGVVNKIHIVEPKIPKKETAEEFINNSIEKLAKIDEVNKKKPLVDELGRTLEENIKAELDSGNNDMHFKEYCERNLKYFNLTSEQMKEEVRKYFKKQNEDFMERLKKREEEKDIDEEVEEEEPKDEETIKDILVDEMQEQEKEDYIENEINWLPGDFWNEWDMVKGRMKKMWGHKKEYIGEPPEWCLLAHDKDKIRGKPQLIENVQKKIPLVKLAVKKEKDTGELHEEGYINESGEIEIQSFFFFDERFDVRYNGYLADTFSLYFHIYQVITEDAKKYFILTQKKLPNEVCDLKGMLIEMPDFTEMSRSLKLPSISGFFILKDFEPSVKILSKEELINYTKERKISENDWLNFLAYHPLGTMNNFPIETEMLRSSWVLSGKVDGWPMHLGKMGPPGTGKTMGDIETVGYKFEEEPRIAEGSGWTIKGLGPSFKQSIADVGFFAKAHRTGLIDEIGKMCEKEMNKHQTSVNNLLGDFNFLLEHKKRLVGSGNTGEVETKASAKFLFVTNPISNRRTIASHIGIVDPTFMSRIFWWVQDREEQDLVLSEKGVLRTPPQHTQDLQESSPPTSTSPINLLIKNNRKKSIVLGKLWGKICNREEFLTLFDTCYSFLSEIDDKEVNRLVNIVTGLAKEPMKSSVWRPRGYHHVKLLIDGLCKHRCLFKDYDVSFKAKEEDYNLAELILTRMVHSWGTGLQPKEGI